jgi:hypothetical protein
MDLDVVNDRLEDSMRTLRTPLMIPLVCILALPAAALAQDRHVVDPAAPGRLRARAARRRTLGARHVAGGR